MWCVGVARRPAVREPGLLTACNLQQSLSLLPTVSLRIVLCSGGGCEPTPRLGGGTRANQGPVTAPNAPAASLFSPVGLQGGWSLAMEVQDMKALVSPGWQCRLESFTAWARLREKSPTKDRHRCGSLYIARTTTTWRPTYYRNPNRDPQPYLPTKFSSHHRSPMASKAKPTTNASGRPVIERKKRSCSECRRRKQKVGGHRERGESGVGSERVG